MIEQRPHGMAATGKIEVVRADLTRERVDAIVNAANAHLANGGGVAGAISCGIYGYPVDEAAPIAVAASAEALSECGGRVELIRFCLIGDR